MAKESVVGPWARDKLHRLEKYLSAYTTIMKEQRWCQGYYYIDAFAGPGSHTVRATEFDNRQFAQTALLEAAEFGTEQKEQQQFLAGSPRVALAIPHPFTSYVFVERSTERVASLEKLKEDYGETRKILIRNQECTKYLEERVAKNPKVDWKTNRAVVFLDPFGMQVGWPTIEVLAATGAIEIFLNFPVGMAIQRLLKKRPEEYTDAQRRKLDDYFGASGWFDVLYKKTQTLFDDDSQEKVNASGQALLKWYRDRLQVLFKHVSKAALIRNTRRGHLYYLLLASNKQTGVKIANEILSAGETV
jgi:three-Cys-motif partner protein